MQFACSGCAWRDPIPPTTAKYMALGSQLHIRAIRRCGKHSGRDQFKSHLSLNISLTLYSRMAVPDQHTFPESQRKSGVLDSSFKFEEATPFIGREYPEVYMIVEIFNT